MITGFPSCSIPKFATNTNVLSFVLNLHAFEFTGVKHGRGDQLVSLDVIDILQCDVK